jgi:hypothetical protein
MGFLGTTIFRITNSRAKDTLQRGGQRVASGFPFALGQPRTIPMPFGFTFGKKFFDQFGGIARDRLLHRAGGGLCHIGEGEKCRFGGLGNGSAITKRGFLDGRNIFIPQPQDFSSGASIFLLLEGFLIKVPDERGAVVLADGLSNSARKTVLAS